jgi:hypothetical protein
MASCQELPVDDAGIEKLSERTISEIRLGWQGSMLAYSFSQFCSSLLDEGRGHV